MPSSDSKDLCFHFLAPTVFLPLLYSSHHPLLFRSLTPAPTAAVPPAALGAVGFIEPLFRRSTTGESDLAFGDAFTLSYLCTVTT